MHANINGGLLSDPMLRASLGSGGVGGWKEERSERLEIYDGWAISFLSFFFHNLCLLLCVFEAVSCVSTCLHVRHYLCLYCMWDYFDHD